MAQAASPRTGVEFTPWFDLADFYNKTAAAFNAQMAVVRLIISIIIVLCISNTLHDERHRANGEIGT